MTTEQAPPGRGAWAALVAAAVLVQVVLAFVGGFLLALLVLLEAPVGALLAWGWWRRWNASRGRVQVPLSVVEPGRQPAGPGGAAPSQALLVRWGPRRLPALMLAAVFGWMLNVMMGGVLIPATTWGALLAVEASHPRILVAMVACHLMAAVNVLTCAVLRSPGRRAHVLVAAAALAELALNAALLFELGHRALGLWPPPHQGSAVEARLADLIPLIMAPAAVLGLARGLSALLGAPALRRQALEIAGREALLDRARRCGTAIEPVLS